MKDALDLMPESVERTRNEQEIGKRRGDVSFFTCPECGGAMWQADEEALVRFRCHVGHAYLGEALLQEQSEALEAALWTAVRTFKERGVLAQQLARRERAAGGSEAASRFEEEARLAERYAELIQHHVLRPAERRIEDPNQSPSISVS